MENRYDHITFDQTVRALWERQKTYQQTNPDYAPFTIDTPPPTISGSLHIGHIFSYTQTDIIARYKRMTGHNVFYPFGFDGNGLATERFVEKKYKTNVSKVGREKFIDICLQATEEMKEQFVSLWQQMGLSANFEQTYSTIDKKVQKISQESFLILAKKGFAYIKNEPAIFCTHCRTTVAQAELDDLEQQTVFNDIVFKTADGQELTIATTRPELLPSCVAIMYHPDDHRYQQLRNKKVFVPIFEQEVPVIADELVQPDKGTGLVMVCTFGDKTDIEWFKKHNLPHRQSIEFNGKFAEHCGPIAGLNVKDARKAIIELLKEQHILTHQKDITNTVNVHERCKHAIEYLVLPQWFIKVVENKETFLELAEKITWNPTYMKSRFVDWVSNLSWDWCISRQRVFGIPFPVWYCNDCKEILLAKSEDLPIDPTQTPYAGPCPSCKGNDIRAEKDVMDTWNTSSLTPYICKQLYNKTDVSPFEDKTFLPMSMRPQAHDIIRTWAFYTIVKSWMHEKQIPWHEIVISGYVLSEQKEKISKSKNNAPTEPEQLLKLYAPDAIRFWTASGTLGQDVAFSPDQIKIGQKLLTKLWNACKFAHMNLTNYQHNVEKTAQLDVVNQWMLDQSSKALSNYNKAFEKHEFSIALDSVQDLFWNDFCDNYIEIIKDQFFNPDNYTDEHIKATQWTLYTTTFMVLQLYAPYLPHITEQIYQTMFAATEKASSIHLTQLQTTQKTDEQNAKHMRIILDIIGQVRKLKTQHELALRTELESLTIAITNAEIQTLINDQQAILKGVCKAKQIITTTQELSGNLEQVDEKYQATVVVKL